MTPSSGRKTFHDEQSVFDFAWRNLQHGKSLSDIEYELVARHDVSSWLLRRALPPIQVICNARALEKMRYGSWLWKVFVTDLLLAGPAGVLLVAALIPLALWLGYQMSSLLLLIPTFDQAPALITLTPLSALAALLCIPVAWLLGWPLFLINRVYWRWRADRLAPASDYTQFPL